MPILQHQSGLKIKSIDYEIDWLVYGLYGLTEGDIKIVEGHPSC